MTTADHLPECLHSRPCERAVRGTGDRHVVSGGRCDNCDDPCICDRLRACTVRVLGEAREATCESDHGDELIVINRLIDDATQEAP